MESTNTAGNKPIALYAVVTKSTFLVSLERLLSPSRLNDNIFVGASLDRRRSVVMLLNI